MVAEGLLDADGHGDDAEAVPCLDFAALQVEAELFRREKEHVLDQVLELFFVGHGLVAGCWWLDVLLPEDRFVRQ